MVVDFYIAVYSGYIITRNVPLLKPLDNKPHQQFSVPNIEKTGFVN